MMQIVRYGLRRVTDGTILTVSHFTTSVQTHFKFQTDEGFPIWMVKTQQTADAARWGGPVGYTCPKHDMNPDDLEVVTFTINMV